MNVELVVGVVLGIWTAGLTGLVVFFWIKFSSLTKLGGGGLMKALDNVFKKEKNNEKEIKILKKSLEALGNDCTFHTQKVGLVRFNPFSETGGNHSFSLALLNDRDTGFIMTGLHTRERTRLYVKPVSNGKSKYELSKDELSALEKAKESKEI